MQDPREVHLVQTLYDRKSICIVFFYVFIFISILFLSYGCSYTKSTGINVLKADFIHPPDSSRPGVYWYFMDGWMSERGIKEDLESMKNAGIGGVVFLEVNVGVPKGPVDFLSEQWFELFRYAVEECSKLDIAMTLGVGPGWAGSGGPWIEPAQSMQQLVSGSIQVSGPGEKTLKLPLPKPKEPYFGEGIFPPKLKEQWKDYYKDVAVLAFPATRSGSKVKDVNEKALYYRAPFSSRPGVKAFLPTSTTYSYLPANEVINKKRVINLSDRLQPDGILKWEVPPGDWTVMRFVSRNTGALTRPAPIQGMGFECNKMDTAAVNWQLKSYVGRILNMLGKPDPNSPGGLKTLHLDSWEMGAQNWSVSFRKEFKKRRGYDPLSFYPVYAGNIVGSLEESNRFLWDVRKTCSEMIYEDYVTQLKAYAHRHGLNFSVEPYDMNPTADLDLGSIADIPMAEFWSEGYGFNSAFSCIEATSIAHIEGRRIVQSEAFTSDGSEAWKQYPGAMKNQGDWASATGINRFYYHTFAHKPLTDSLYPGMTMGPYGVHWDRKQSWWPMVSSYHQYITRCQFMLQQGKPVADILYLTPEGAPQVFLPPPSALAGNSVLPDRKGYNFDGCSPKQLYQARVKNHEIVFPSGASYHLLVLPAVETMTPVLLTKIKSLVVAGATVVGIPPLKSPSLSGYPECDQEVKDQAAELWGSLESPENQTIHKLGDGKIIWGGSIGKAKGPIQSLGKKQVQKLYPDYKATAAILDKMGIQKDFESTGPVRYTHRTTKDWDIYFVSNRTDEKINTQCIFRTEKGVPALWNPLTGETRKLPEFSVKDGRTNIPLEFYPYQSFFIVFAKENKKRPEAGKNFPELKSVIMMNGPWELSFDPDWGGPAKVIFDSLTDWTQRPEKGIRYYSGIATYQKDFDFPQMDKSGKRIYLNLGEVKDLAHIWMNGKDLGVLWTAPWQVDITDIVNLKNNHLKIEIANLWPNRLIGDQHLPYDGIKKGQFPDWVRKGEKRKSGRYTFTTYNPYSKDSPLLPSGLLGPVSIQTRTLN